VGGRKISFAEGLLTEAERARSGDLRPSQSEGLDIEVPDEGGLYSERMVIMRAEYPQ